jgi:hypothetical protein
MEAKPRGALYTHFNVNMWLPQTRLETSINTNHRYRKIALRQETKCQTWVFHRGKFFTPVVILFTHLPDMNCTDCSLYTLIARICQAGNVLRVCLDWTILHLSHLYIGQYSMARDYVYVRSDSQSTKCWPSRCSRSAWPFDDHSMLRVSTSPFWLLDTELTLKIM